VTPQSSEQASQRIPGRKPVLEALSDPDVAIETVFVDRAIHGPLLQRLRHAGSERSVPVKIVPREKLDRLAGGATHQGVVAIASPFVYRNFDEILSEVAGTRDQVVERCPLVLVLDRITDPRNLGAILRSAVAFDVRAVIIPLSGSAPVNSVAIKASAGAALRVGVARVSDLADALYQMKERGYWIVGTVGSDAPSVWSTDWNRPIGIVIGSEEAGMSSSVEGVCDELVSIPTSHAIESLNASVAAGIVLGTASHERLSTQA
jgi:23S rRNA (guanosine2251-2'-O)-methyltransferase